MIATIISIVRGLGFMVIGLVLCYFLYDYVGTVRVVGDYKETVVRWEGKYNAAVDAQKQSENTIAQLRDDRVTLMADLVTWKQAYEDIDKKSNKTRQQLRKLETQNEEIRTTLRTRVPDDVWRLLFPRTASPGNSDNHKSGETGISSGVSATVR